MDQLTVALHGVTGRMGMRQHLLRSIGALIREGGLKLSDGGKLSIRPVLVGRDPKKLRLLAGTTFPESVGVSAEWTTDVQDVLSDSTVDVFFDSATTAGRPEILRQAILAGKAIYCEKPVALEPVDAVELADMCDRHRVKNGVVQDKLWLPGIVSLRSLMRRGFFGRILSVRGEFGYWVFTGHDPKHPPQRPSWNNRRQDGGGMIRDMFCHWNYLIQDLFGPIDRVIAHASTGLPSRIDEEGREYDCTADDSAYAIMVLQSGVNCQFHCSWTTRVRRDDLLTLHVDGTDGSAVVGLRDVWTQGLVETPRPFWDPDVPQPLHFLDGWSKIPAVSSTENAFKTQWELFLRHVVEDGPYESTIRRGAEDVELAAAAETSWHEQRWVRLGD